MEHVSIRPIKRQDNARLATLIRSIFEDLNISKTGTAYADENLDNLFDFYQQPGAAYYVVVFEAEVIGGAGFTALKGGSPDTCELQKMYLAEPFRGRGFGRIILKHCLGKAREFGYSHCYLETMPFMKAAQALYKKFGFSYLKNPLGNTGHSACHVWMQLSFEATESHL